MALVADIVKVDAPVSVLPGDYAIVDVTVKNISGSDKDIAITGVFDSSNITEQFNDLILSPSQVVVFRGWFIMPNDNVRLTIWSWYWNGTSWVHDATNYVDISLATLVPTISEFLIQDFVKV